MKTQKNIIAVIAVMFFMFVFWPEKSSACEEGWFVKSHIEIWPEGVKPIFEQEQNPSSFCQNLYGDPRTNYYGYYGCQRVQDWKCYKRSDCTYDSCYWNIYPNGCQRNHGSSGCEASEGHNMTHCAGMSCGEGGGGGAPPPIPPRPPCTVALSANPTEISPNGSAKLTWTTTGTGPAPCVASSDPADAEWDGNDKQSRGGNEVVFPLNTTTYSIYCSGGGGCGDDAVVVVRNLMDNAEFIAYENLPAKVNKGTEFTASIIMRNTGDTTWTSAGNYKLGSQNDQDNTTWKINRIEITSDTNGDGQVAPGEFATFTANFTAPSLIGSYNFQWKMLIESVKWFGEPSTLTQITVEEPPIEPPKFDCPTDCNLWSDWSSCAGTCGSGIGNKFRTCNDSRHGDCIEMKNCSPSACPPADNTTGSGWIEVAP